jgi:hypothetical protein
MTLWAICRDDREEFFAAPSLEAARAACTEPGDYVVPWPWDSTWHSLEAPHFLDQIDGGVLQ